MPEQEDCPEQREQVWRVPQHIVERNQNKAVFPPVPWERREPRNKDIDPVAYY